MSNSSKHEDALALQLHELEILYERQFKAIPNRQFAFDFAFPKQRLLVEVQGGIWMKKGGHNTGSGITRDCEKLSLAAANGWKVLPVTPKQIKAGKALEWILLAIGDSEIHEAIERSEFVEAYDEYEHGDDEIPESERRYNG